MSRKHVWLAVDGEMRAELQRHGKKKYLLRITYVDATQFAWRTQDVALPFGAVNAITAAKAYWELARVRRE